MGQSDSLQSSVLSSYVLVLATILSAPKMLQFILKSEKHVFSVKRFDSKIYTCSVQSWLQL